MPRLADGARARDERIEAEWVAQHHARDVYLDPHAIMNRWEERVVPGLLDALGPVDGPVIDVGCGVGHLGRAVAARGAPIELVGVDLQEELLADARAGYAARVEGDAHRLPLGDGAFAGAVAANLLHHVADAVAVTREIARVVRPGARIVAADPRRLAPIELAKRVVRRHDRAFTREHRAFELAEYRSLFEAAGLIVEDLRATDPLAPLVATGLDLVGAGRLGVASAVAAGLVAVDRAVARLDRGGALGTMLLAVVRAP